MSDDSYIHSDSQGDASGEGDSAGADRHARRAAEHFRRGRLAEAESELRRALRKSPSRGDLHFNLGLTLDAAGRLDEALASFRQATAHLPRQMEVRLAEATTLCRLNRFEEALGPLEAACAIDPSNDLAWARRIEALTFLRRFEEAETTYYIAQHRIDSIPLCLAAMGETQLAHGRHERAAWCFREALSIEPLMPRLRARLARALVAGGHHESALRLYHEELREQPGDVQTLLECGDLLASQHRVAEAMEKYRRAAELAPALAMPHVRLGLLLGALGRNEQALAEFETAYGLDPDVPLCRSSYAATLVNSGERGSGRGPARVATRAAALRLLRQDIERRRDVESDAAAAELCRIADLLLALHEPADAIAPLDRAVARRPHDVALLRKLMVVLFAARQSRRARGVARRLARLDPGAGAAVEHNLILDLLRAGRARLAAARLRAALRRYPADAGLKALRVRTWWSLARSGLGDRLGTLRPTRQ